MFYIPHYSEIMKKNIIVVTKVKKNVKAYSKLQAKQNHRQNLQVF